VLETPLPSPDRPASPRARRPPTLRRVRRTRRMGGPCADPRIVVVIAGSAMIRPRRTDPGHDPGSPPDPRSVGPVMDPPRDDTGFSTSGPTRPADPVKLWTLVGARRHRGSRSSSRRLVRPRRGVTRITIPTTSDGTRSAPATRSARSSRASTDAVDGEHAFADLDPRATRGRELVGSTGFAVPSRGSGAYRRSACIASGARRRRLGTARASVRTNRWGPSSVVERTRHVVSAGTT